MSGQGKGGKAEGKAQTRINKNYTDNSASSNSEREKMVILVFILYFTVKTNVYQNLIKLVFSLI